MRTNQALEIQPVSQAQHEEAFSLLQRFFVEEGFDTPIEVMRSSLQLMLADPGCAVFLARQGSQTVGVATVTTSLGLEYGRSAEIEDLYVLPEARRQGIAVALIEAACAWCREAGVSVVLVTVTPQGNASHGLLDYYTQRGFATTGRVIMERPL